MKKTEKTAECGKLSVKALALALGLLWGAYLFVLGLILSAFPNVRLFSVSPEWLNILATLYPGYAATIVGSFLGLVWGFICGVVGGTLLAWLYNLALEKYGR